MSKYVKCPFPSGLMIKILDVALISQARGASLAHINLLYLFTLTGLICSDEFKLRRTTL
jgi:hypothetical protein